MLSGKRFKLTRLATGLHLSNGTAKVVTIPAGGIIEVLSVPNGNGNPHDKGLAHILKQHDKGLVYALCEGQTVALFAVDVEARGIEVKEPDREFNQPHHKSARA